MRYVTILCEHKRPRTCADCGQPSKLLTRAYNRFTQSEVRLCPPCIVWHDRQVDDAVQPDHRIVHV